MTYSNTDIFEAIKYKQIEISNFNLAQLGTNSYDVQLGNTFYEVFWDNDGPYFVGPYVYLDGEKVTIPVGGTLLGITKERIGTHGKVIAELRSRSSIRRVGIDPCMAAGMGDIGYNDFWVMEFTSFVRGGPVWDILKEIARVLTPLLQKLHFLSCDAQPFLVAGEIVAQMVFAECKSKPTKEYDGQYRSEWPLNMIPKRYRHRVISPKDFQND